MSDTHEQISSPVPLAFWRREVLVGGEGEWFVEKDEPTVLLGTAGGRPAEPITLRPSLKPISDDACKLPDLAEACRTNPQLDAFLFWSRAPFATRAADGSVILYDARFYDPRARGRFSVALPDVACEELPAG